METETKVLSTEFFAFFQGNRNHQETRMIFLKILRVTEII
ncbi:hypothetical protein BSM4216_1783 [Bacillus smithii]|nr:hypothetical protein BSM4216_1783 [Bacillus smithii]